MLEKQAIFKIRKNNLYISCDRYKMTELKLDLETSKITIRVEFYKNNNLVHIKTYDMGECGDTDVNELIKELHKRIYA